MNKRIILKGNFDINKWEESEIENGTSTGRVIYKFNSKNELTGNASYIFYYLKHSRKNPLESHSLYTGFIVVEIEIDGKKETINIKDEGEFRDGKAVSKLTVIGNDSFTGEGSYEASHTGSSFELIISY